jgi:two-component system sensor histidine kinase AtoS
MTTAFPSRPATGPPRRSKAPGETEFSALFQLLTAPALLVDNPREQIVLANSPFLQLTAFAVNEVITRGLRSLVSGLPAHVLAGDEVLSVLLDRRNRKPLPANLQVRALDANGQWLALTFEPQENPRKSLMGRMEQIGQTLVEINRLPEQESLRQTLNRGLSAARQALELSVAAVYRMEDGDALAWKAAEAGEPNLLPDTISPNDLLRLSQTFVWRPGRRVQTDLHRAARMKDLTYLASVPISHNGLLVLADRVQEAPEHLGTVIETLGKQFSGMLENVSQLMNLRELALENRRDLCIWRSVGENAQEGILLVTPDLTVNEMNPAAEWMLGYADWEVKGQSVESILIGPERLLSALETACQGIPTHNMGSVSLHRRNGQSFPAHIQIMPVQREGETLALVIFFSDVSEHEEIRNRTQQLEQRAVLGEVTAVFAHEVRNPINNISTGLQLLTVKLPENDPNQENINRLLNDCTRLNHLMEAVLNFSRQVEHKFESVDLEALLKRLLDRWRPRMAKVNVTAFFQVEPDTPPVLGDPRSLEQVFTNLISNAVEAMSGMAAAAGSAVTGITGALNSAAISGETPAGSTASSPISGGTLAVRVGTTNQLPGRPQVEVSITDNGPGIPDDVRERIFEPFVTTKAQGTGLGLAITKRIVTAHHGSIRVNTFPGGTVFYVVLSAFQGEKE